MSVSASHIPPNLPQFPQLNGVFVLNKLAGSSSAQSLNIFKKLGQKKIGHAGTLDPFASGVLLVLLGHATKLADYLHEGDRKIYQGTIRLGMETDTWDSTGSIISQCAPVIRAESLLSALKEWESLQEQEVPPYSAAKYNGKCFYSLTRNGQQVPRRLKKVEIFRVELLNFNSPLVTFRVFCGSGVYIRSLAHSLGKRLGCGACLDKLTREYSYPFAIAQAITPEMLEKAPEILPREVHPCQDCLPEWKQIALSSEEIKMVQQGKAIRAKNDFPSGTRAFLLQQEKCIAFAEVIYNAGQPWWQIKRGLWN